MTKTIILSSGGTGGHVFPALSLGEELQKKGFNVVIMTDERGQVFQSAKGVSKVISLPVWRGRGPFKLVGLGFGLVLSFFIALTHMIRHRPAAVIGFGGYPSLPAILASYVLRIPSGLHEQNAVLGRANRLVARLVKRIALSYEKVSLTEPFQAKLIYTGNPVRSSIIMIREIPYQAPKDNEPFRLLIIGGSQGAKIFSDVIPAALCNLPADLRQRLLVQQQCRQDQLERTTLAYKNSNISVDIRPFFEDIQQSLKEAHLIIARSGASTVAELMVSGRPALLVPYAAAMDNHQQANASSLGDNGAAWVVLEKEFTSEKVQELIKKAMANPKNMEAMSKKMYVFGQPEAATKLALMVEDLIVHAV